jgi:hypothetical protein
MGIILVSFLAVLKNLSPNHRYGFNIIDVFVALFCLSYFPSTILSHDLMGTGRLAFRFIFIPAVTYFTLKSLVTSEWEYKRLLILFLAAIGVFALTALLMVGLTGERGIIMGMPPIGSATLAVFAICNLVYSGWWRKKLGLAILLLSVLLIGMTLARAYFVGLLASPILYRLIRKGHAFILCIIFFPATLVATLFLTWNPSVLTPAATEFAARKSIERVTNIDFWKQALYNRALSYREGLSNFKKHPVFGTGLQVGDDVITRHNFHIEWLEYGGAVGYLVCLALFFSYYAAHRGVAQFDVFCAVNLCVVLLVLVNSLTNGLMHGLMPYMTLIGIGLAEARKKFIRRPGRGEEMSPSVS